MTHNQQIVTSTRPASVAYSFRKGLPRGKQLIEELLQDTDIAIDGNRAWDVRVNDDRFYQRVIGDGSLGLGESYMDGWWDCQRLDLFFEKLIRSGVENRIRGNWKMLLSALGARLFNRQSIRRAFQVGKQHYDVGNELYRAMLGPRMQYSCGYFGRGAKTLDQAQEDKLHLICSKLGMRPGMKILDVGCGWGGFAKFAAEEYGAEVTGLTVSAEQVALGRQLCAGLPVELHCQDYRTASGQFDRVTIIGCIEHFGYKNYRTYMKTVDRCLKSDGIAFIHTIGHNYSIRRADPWLDKYIFPNGMNPSIKQLGAAMEDLFVMEDWHNFGQDYYQTLMAWHDNFQQAWPDLDKSYNERFRRMWEYYLLFCAGGFKARFVQLWQIVMTKPGHDQPACRLK
jgi:cyclopropane-fatty-acyl-phospholipid synthase